MEDEFTFIEFYSWGELWLCGFMNVLLVGGEQAGDSVVKYHLKYQGFCIIQHLPVKQVMGDVMVRESPACPHT